MGEGHAVKRRPDQKKKKIECVWETRPSAQKIKKIFMLCLLTTESFLKRIKGGKSSLTAQLGLLYQLWHYVIINTRSAVAS